MKSNQGYEKRHQKKNHSKKQEYKKKHYPSKQGKLDHSKKYHPQKKQNQTPINTPAVKNDFFGGNLVSNMDFGGSDQELSGYVKRELIVEDRYGNKQTAREKQFFNSGKKLGKVTVNDDESNF